MQNRDEVRQQMFVHIEQWKQSNLTQKLYCEQHNIAYQAFHYWYKRYKNNSPVNLPASFVPLQVQQQNVQPHVELLLSDGRRIVFHQPVSSEFLKALIN